MIDLSLITEILRGGMMAIPKGRWEAAYWTVCHNQQGRIVVRGCRGPRADVFEADYHGKIHQVVLHNRLVRIDYACLFWNQHASSWNFKTDNQGNQIIFGENNEKICDNNWSRIGCSASEVGKSLQRGLT